MPVIVTPTTDEVKDLDVTIRLIPWQSGYGTTESLVEVAQCV
jgi:hypothetical protein